MYKKILPLLLLLLFCSEPGYCESSKISLPLLATTNLGTNLPFALFQKDRWEAEGDAKYVKLHFYPDQAFRFKSVRVESCSKDFTDSIKMFINFDEQIRNLKNSGKEASYESSAPFRARSVTFNFEKNQPLCLKQITFFDEGGNKIDISTPRIVRGNASASHTLAPESSYGVMNLFDSKYEYAWSTDKITSGVTLTFQFEKPEKIEQLKIWNGYQRSDIHCFSNARAKNIVLEGEGGYQATLTLKDIMGSQDVILPQPFIGKEFKITITNSYPGKRYQDLVISELRFFDGNSWFMLDPTDSLHQRTSINKQKFLAASLSEILNQRLAGYDVGKKGGEWDIRLRSDGSFYLNGYSYGMSKGQDTMTNFYSLGNYDVVSTTSGKIDIKLYGFLKELKEPLEMDCNGCGRDCNLKTTEFGSKESLFTDYISISKIQNVYKVIHSSKKQRIQFDQLGLNIR